MVIIGRERNPKDWTNVAELRPEYATSGFWIGIVSRRRSEEALKELGKTQEQIDSEAYTWS